MSSEKGFRRVRPEKEKELPRYAYLPFGGGPRVCIGNAFAMMEAQLILATVAQRYRLSLANDQAVELQPQITLSPKGGLKMKIAARPAVEDFHLPPPSSTFS